MPRSVGKPLKLNTDLQAGLVKVIQAGNYLETAAAYVGISVSTLRDWIRRGEREAQRLSTKNAKSNKTEQPYLEFSAAIKKAQAEGEIRDVLLIGNAARETWQAAAWRLERRFPDRWGRKERHELSGPSGGPIEVEDIRNRLLKKFADLNIDKEEKRGKA